MNNNDYKYDARTEHESHESKPSRPTRKPSRFILFTLGWIPGIGHMYLGLIRRGTFYLSALSMAIFLTVVLSYNFSPLVIFTSFAKFGLCAVSFFEAFKLRHEIIAGIEVKDTIPAFVFNKTLWIALGIIIAGSIFLDILWSLRGSVITLIVVIFIAAIITKKRKTNK